MERALAAHEVTVDFGAVRALDAVSCSIAAGSIFGLAGENGAGKSTLMRLFTGFVPPTAGRLEAFGNPVAFANPHDAQQMGIGMVHQHFQLAGALKGWENIILGAEGGPVLPRAKPAEVQQWARALGFEVDLSLPVTALPVGLQQKIEILRVLYRKPRVILFDEPTAVLSPMEVGPFLQQLLRLREQGHTLVLISHRFEELFAVCDRIGVLRAGKWMGDKPTREWTALTLAQAAVGSEIPPLRAAPTVRAQEPRLTLQCQFLPRKHRFEASVHPGEIVGIAGLEGHGQRELVEVLGGLRPYSGTIQYAGREWREIPPSTFWKEGIALAPPQREKESLIGAWTAVENAVLGTQRRFPFWLPRLPLQKLAEAVLTHLGTQPQSLRLPLAHFSGGNQQKFVMARTCFQGTRLLVVANPTRGVDIHASHRIHAKLLQQKAEGCAICVLSFDLEELTQICDRITVLFDGCCLATFLPPYDLQRIGLAMMGKSP